jgi:hypothetical protein
MPTDLSGYPITDQCLKTYTKLEKFLLGERDKPATDQQSTEKTTPQILGGFPDHIDPGRPATTTDRQAYTTQRGIATPPQVPKP